MLCFLLYSVPDFAVVVVNRRISFASTNRQTARRSLRRLTEVCPTAASPSSLSTMMLRSYPACESSHHCQALTDWLLARS